MRMEEKTKPRLGKVKVKRETTGPLGSTISRIEDLINNNKSTAVPRFNKEGFICGWDSLCEHTYGYTAAEVLGRRLQDILQSEQEAKRFEDILRQTLCMKRIRAADEQAVGKGDFKTLRKTGIEIIGDVPWGTHFCQFYQSRQDLIDISVPYCKAGLENNEYCMWVTCEPLQADDARQALAAQVENLDEYIDKRRIEILDYSQWYTKSGAFNAEEILQGWVDKKTQALDRGFDGLRLTGNTLWLPKEQWQEFTAYEAKVNSILGKYRILALCTYNLDVYSGAQITDVVSNHQFALIRRDDKWEIIENSEHKKSLEILRKSEERYRALLDGVSHGIAEINGSGSIIFANKALHEIYRYAEGQLLGKAFFDLIASEAEKNRSRKQISQLQQGQLLSIPYESNGLTKDGRVIDIELRWDYKRDQWGRATGFIGSITDITQRKQTSQLISKTLAFEKAISTISSRFANDTNVNEAISNSLADMGTLTDAGRVRLFLTCEDGVTLKNTHEYCAPGVSSQIDNLGKLSWNRFSSGVNKLQAGEILHVGDVSQLSEKMANEKKAWESQGIKAVLLLPVRIGDDIGGVIAFHNTKKTGQWAQEDIMLLRVCSEIIGSAIHRQRNREHLEQGEEWFRAIADYTCDLESWHGVNGKLLWVNPAVERLTGYSVGECMNMPDYPLPLVHEDDRDDIAKALKQAVKEKTSEDSLPFRIVRKDNTIRWVGISWQPICNEAKSYIGIRSSIRDITLQKFAEEALQESEERHHSLINDVLDSSAVGICIVDAGFNVVWANSALERYFGLSRSNIIGKDSRKLIQKLKSIFDDPEAFAAKVLNAYQNNTYSERFECHVMQGPCRQERWLEHRSMPIRSGLYTGGRIEHYYDITIRKHVEENLYHSQRMLQLVLDSIPVRVFWKDSNLLYLGCNQAFVKDIGLQSPDEVIGKTDDDLATKKDEAEFIKQCDSRVMASGKPEYRIVQRHFRHNGTEAWLETNRIPLRNSAGKIVGILGTYEDVTDRKYAEGEIQRLNRDLEERVARRTAELTRAHKHLLKEIKERKALEQEILEISENEKRMIGQELHDSIGQQLMGTSFLAKVLEGKLIGKLTEEAENAKAIADLVNQTMDQTRALARGLHPVDLDGGSLNSALQDLLASTEKLFPVNCSLKIDQSLSIDDAAVAVNLYRITQEAITNAIKHGKARNIHVELANSSDRAFLIVKNDGLSFPEVSSGSPGIGLRIMDHRAEMVGGSLNIRRNIGGGTVVTCCFPADKFKC